jgi:hypothetical protein
MSGALVGPGASYMTGQCLRPNGGAVIASRRVPPAMNHHSAFNAHGRS